MAQGETLEQQFGEKEVCFRTLDLYTSAVLESTLNPVVQPKADFRTALNEMSKARPNATDARARATYHTIYLLSTIIPTRACITC